jgi:hypothetical protein
MWYTRALAIREQAIGAQHPKQGRHARASLPYSTHWDSMSKQPDLRKLRMSHKQHKRSR